MLINQLEQNLLSLSDVVRAKIIQEYGQETNPLNLVAITEARAIRQRLLATFGARVTVILDWYHLCKKLRQLMSMIAVDKEKTHSPEVPNFSTLAGPGNCCFGLSQDSGE